MKKYSFLMLIWFFFSNHVFSEEIFISLKKNKVNVRYGPSFDSPIKYIYKKLICPLNKSIKKKISEELLIKKIIVAGYTYLN